MAQVFIALFFSVLCFASVYGYPRDCPNERRENVTRGAICILKQNQDYTGQLRFSGVFRLTETKGKPLTIEANIHGISLAATNEKVKRGLHVHQFGQISESCQSSGPDFNPTKKSHGDKDSANRHVGDYGNIELMTKSTVSVTLVDTVSSLFGDDTILGRSIVVHESEDDLGTVFSEESKAHGNSGGIVSCCVIALETESTLDG